ncbi:hypothetical protein EDEG_00349 [Edhazardia aedis USNM 41457]|uniref:CCHC-type domain-containing protein n=1 Tax=Edhazardia aedis (strain USNM 41457) TaxID=1003232 RepID=J9DGU0_EDHAE|nr:hypothetical protein EDEG_00349 [Edhazardia aedis USNM 41457]|eukprot:EJW01825.1 hypothetical protein EDEG_00349 [Edhazardia aedis USNM 41457]
MGVPSLFIYFSQKYPQMFSTTFYTDILCLDFNAIIHNANRNSSEEEVLNNIKEYIDSILLKIKKQNMAYLSSIECESSYKSKSDSKKFCGSGSGGIEAKQTSSFQNVFSRSKKTDKKNKNVNDYDNSHNNDMDRKEDSEDHARFMPKLLFISIDGVAPRAKLNQQRARRYVSVAGKTNSETKDLCEDQVKPENFCFGRKVEAEVVKREVKSIEINNRIKQISKNITENVCGDINADMGTNESTIFNNTNEFEKDDDGMNNIDKENKNKNNSMNNIDKENKNKNNSINELENGDKNNSSDKSSPFEASKTPPLDKICFIKKESPKMKKKISLPLIKEDFSKSFASIKEARKSTKNKEDDFFTDSNPVYAIESSSSEIDIDNNINSDNFDQNEMNHVDNGDNENNFNDKDNTNISNTIKLNRNPFDISSSSSEDEKLIHVLPKIEDLNDESSDYAEWDTNAITPGTYFMEKVDKTIHNYIEEKLRNDKEWRNMRVIYSSSKVEGEGEQKILRFIRNLDKKYGTVNNISWLDKTLNDQFDNQFDIYNKKNNKSTTNTINQKGRNKTEFARTRKVYAENNCLSKTNENAIPGITDIDPKLKSHYTKNSLFSCRNNQITVYSPDADLFFLGMTLENITLMRENQQLRKCMNCQKKGHLTNDCQNILKTLFIFVNLNLLKREIVNEICEKIPFKAESERIIHDYILICFLCGNDFLPTINCFDVRFNAIEILTNNLIRFYTRFGRYLSKNGNINFKVFNQFLYYLSKHEDNLYRRKLICLRELKRKFNMEYIKDVDLSVDSDKILYYRQKLFYNKFINDGLIDNINIFDAHNMSNNHNLCNNISNSNNQSNDTLNKNSGCNNYNIIDSTKQSNIDSANINIQSDNNSKLLNPLDYNTKESLEKLRKKCAIEYLKGLQWTLNLYIKKQNNWGYFYPYHYSPLLEDFNLIHYHDIQQIIEYTINVKRKNINLEKNIYTLKDLIDKRDNMYLSNITNTNNKSNLSNIIPNISNISADYNNNDINSTKNNDYKILKNIPQLINKNDLNSPLTLFEQSIIVLPPYSKETLHTKVKQIYENNENNLMIFPKDFKSDMFDKMLSWQSIPLLPFVDIQYIRSIFWLWYQDQVNLLQNTIKQIKYTNLSDQSTINPTDKKDSSIHINNKINSNENISNINNQIDSNSNTSNTNNTKDFNTNINNTIDSTENILEINNHTDSNSNTSDLNNKIECNLKDCDKTLKNNIISQKNTENICSSTESKHKNLLNKINGINIQNNTNNSQLTLKNDQLSEIQSQLPEITNIIDMFYMNTPQNELLFVNQNIAEFDILDLVNIQGPVDLFYGRVKPWCYGTTNGNIRSFVFESRDGSQ